MDLSIYTELTGLTVPTGQQALFTATIRRTKSMLETMLGFTLDPAKVNTNLYNELGKTTLECACPSVDTDNLQPPDAVVTAYRLYHFNSLDSYFHVDPFSKLNKVKLVFIRPGAGNNGITLKTFDNDQLRSEFGRDGWSKYIEHCLNCLCDCKCDKCVQLAVDADWLWTEDIPEDLLYVWAEMVTYYTNSKQENLKSESIDTHSYTFRDNVQPEIKPQNLAVLKKYAGPYGSVAVMPV